MDAKKRTVIGVLILLLIAITVYGTYFKKPSLRLTEMIESENLDDLSLTIYYMSPSIFTFFPVTIDGLIDSCKESKIVICGSNLAAHIDLFKQINNNDMKRVWKKSPYMDVRLYYVLESKKNGKLFDVAMWGFDETIYVNGIEVMGSDIFYDVIIPFMPEDVVEDWVKWGMISKRTPVDDSNQSMVH